MRMTTKLRNKRSTTNAETKIVVFYCKSGKRLSVALAWPLTQHLRQLNYSVDLWHSMREYWHIGSCRECDQCNTDSIDAFKAGANIVGPQKIGPRR